ncbi:MAG: non-homologous end-joining DNA ligase [Bdellovibrionota bacterium]
MATKSPLSRAKRVGRPKQASARKKAVSAGARDESSAILRRAPKEVLPSFVPPELATRVDHAPVGDEWVHEIKLDGYRILARKDGTKVSLLTRNNLNWSTKAASLASAVKGLPCKSAFLDGEWVVLDENGVSTFQHLQQFMRLEDESAESVYFAFDLLHLNGRNLRSLPLLERKLLLEQLLAESKDTGIRYSEHVVGNGPEMFQAAEEQKLEGIISKRANAAYLSGRTKDWLKIKCDNRQEFLILGFTVSSNDKRSIGALLLGVTSGGKLRYSGKIGTGFSESVRKQLFQQLTKIKVESSPVTTRVAGATWVKPTYIAQVAFRELTNEGLIRQGVFHGIREDLSPKDVGIEPVLKTESALSTKGQATPKRGKKKR